MALAFTPCLSGQTPLFEIQRLFPGPNARKQFLGAVESAEAAQPGKPGRLASVGRAGECTEHLHSFACPASLSATPDLPENHPVLKFSHAGWTGNQVEESAALPGGGGVGWGEGEVCVWGGDLTPGSEASFVTMK